jgi:hypothetical protein
MDPAFADAIGVWSPRDDIGVRLTPPVIETHS